MSSEVWVADPHLLDAADLAVNDFCTEILAMAPRLGRAAIEWAESVHPGMRTGRFVELESFPLVMLPWLFERHHTGTVDQEFQRQLMKSSVAGYFAIRILDNAVDDRSKEAIDLAPAASLFSVVFTETYAGYFRTSSDFWDFLSSNWGIAAESAYQERLLRTVTRTDFETVAALKTRAALIPLKAVSIRYSLEGPFSDWRDLFSCFAKWHQFADDMSDWEKDLKSGQPTYFLSEMERRRGDCERESSWAQLDGFEWALSTLDTWMAEAISLTGNIGCSDLTRYLQSRHEKTPVAGRAKGAS